MAETFAQMEERAISNANVVTATEALNLLKSDPNALLVDVRDESEGGGHRAGIARCLTPMRAMWWIRP